MSQLGGNSKLFYSHNVSEHFHRDDNEESPSSIKFHIHRVARDIKRVDNVIILRTNWNPFYHVDDKNEDVKWNLLQFLSATNITFLSETVKISLHFIDNIFQLFSALQNTLCLKIPKIQDNFVFIEPHNPNAWYSQNVLPHDHFQGGKS